MTEKQLQNSPRLKALATECQTLGQPIRFALCDLNALAGTVLRHCIGFLDRLFAKEEPLIFKIGITHNPQWRWGNKLYGYITEKDKWTEMVIIHYSREPYSPAMLEAALIEKYNSYCVAFGFRYYSFVFSMLVCSRMFWNINLYVSHSSCFPPCPFFHTKVDLDVET